MIIFRVLLLFHLALVRKHEFADKTTVLVQENDVIDDQILTVKKDANKKSRPDDNLFSILTDEINGVVGGGIISYYHIEDELYDDEVKGIKFGASSNEINLNKKDLNNNILDCIYWTSFGTSSNELNLNEKNIIIYDDKSKSSLTVLDGIAVNNVKSNSPFRAYSESIEAQVILCYDSTSRAYSESTDDRAMACYDVIFDDKRHLHDADGILGVILKPSVKLLIIGIVTGISILCFDGIYCMES